MVGELHEADLGALLEALEPDERPRLVELLGLDFDFTALTEVDDTVRDEILDELPSKTVAEGVRDLDSDDAVAILEGLAQEDRAEILDQLPPSERVALARSLEYPEESAGRRMQTEFIAVTPSWTVGQAIDYMRETVDLPDRFYELYVVDEAQHFLGAVPLDRLLRSKRPVPVSELMEPERRRVHATEDQEDVARLFQRYDLVAAPVVDTSGPAGRRHHLRRRRRRHRGRGGRGHQGARRRHPRRRAVRLGVDHRARPFQLAVGQSRHRVPREFRARPVRRTVAEDGGAGGAGAGRGEPGRQRHHPDHDGGGARARHPRPHRRQCLARDHARDAGRLLNGLAFAVITGVVAYAWFRVPGLALVIGLAMICNLLAAALGGILIPLGLNRLKIDPAVASSPFVTTVTDVVGFFSFLSIATLWFGLR